MIIETERLTVGPLRETDKEDYFRNISHDKKVLETFICRYAETLEDFDFTQYLDNRSLYAVRLKETGRLIGIMVTCDETEDSCEIGYGLGSDYWGRGYATEAVRAFIAYCFGEKGLRTVCASFFTGNDASRRVMEKCGMTFSRFSEKELTYLGIERDLTYYAVTREKWEELNSPSGDLRLYIPRPEDGWFYVKMMSDPATMAYNAPWFPPDGCIPDAESEWQDLQKDWIGQSPDRFYAFLQRISDSAFVGDVNYHYNPGMGWHDMGIVIFAPERGKGYGKQGLRLLLDRAFRTDGVPRLHNDFETSRGAAYRIHKAVGFRDAGAEDGLFQLELTREEYLNRNT